MLDDVKLRKSRQTIPITVSVTREQQAKLKELAAANGLNMSELARYALTRLIREPYIFLWTEHTDDIQDG